MRIETSHSITDQNAHYWFLIDFPNVAINRIHYNTSESGAYIRMYFLFAGRWAYNWDGF